MEERNGGKNKLKVSQSLISKFHFSPDEKEIFFAII